MGIPISQMWTVVSYVLRQRIAGNRQYPLVLMLEPLFRCNLACAGCGKIQYPAHVLKMNMTPEQCFKAVDECGAPMVSIPGGEPLMHPEIAQIVEGLVARKKYIYLCTNALLLKEKLHLFKPSKYPEFFRCMWMAIKSITIFRCARKADSNLPWRASARPLRRASGLPPIRRFSTAPIR